MLVCVYLLAALPVTQSFTSFTGAKIPWITSLSPLQLSSSPTDIIASIKEFETMGENDLGMALKSPLCSSASPHETADYDEYVSPLEEDISTLLNILGEVIKRGDEGVYEFFEEFRAEAVARSNGDTDALGRMISSVRGITAANALGVTRAFTQTLNLINAAEVHHRTRRLREADIASNRITPLPLKEDSVCGTIEKVIADKVAAGTSLEDAKDEIYQNLMEQKVEFVLTAHPTEVNRRTLLRKYRSISESLSTLDRKDLTPYEREQALYSLRREVASIWGSDEIRRQKPTPQQESRGGLAILESVLWDAVPSYLRKLNSQCILSLGTIYFNLTFDFTVY
jgi:phosphoenolpyruvate carboxylase